MVEKERGHGTRKEEREEATAQECAGRNGSFRDRRGDCPVEEKNVVGVCEGG